MVPTTITALRNTVRHRMDVCIPCLSVDATAPRPPTDGPRARRPWKVWPPRVPLGLVTLRSLDFALGRGVVPADDALQRRRDAGAGHKRKNKGSPQCLLPPFLRPVTTATTPEP